MVRQEREDRINDLEAELGPMRSDLGNLQTGLDNERTTRTNREKEILQLLSDESAKLQEQLQDEKDGRQKKTKEMSEQLTSSTSDMKSNMDRFEKKTNEDFGNLREDLDREMDSRFAHQNELIDDMSQFITTFQKTLKVVGNNDPNEKTS